MCLHLGTLRLSEIQEGDGPAFRQHGAKVAERAARRNALHHDDARRVSFSRSRGGLPLLLGLVLRTPESERPLHCIILRFGHDT